MVAADVRVSVVDKDDLTRCAQLRANAWNNLDDSVVPHIVKEDQGFERKMKSVTYVYEKTLTGERMFLKSLMGDNIVGICIFHLDIPELGALYVDPSYQGMGIGSALFAGIVSLCRKKGVEQFFLWGLLHNTQSKAFYLRKGCVCTGETDEWECCGETLTSVKYIYDIN